MEALSDFQVQTFSVKLISSLQIHRLWKGYRNITSGLSTLTPFLRQR
jgi:hypothetical protein